MVVAQVTVGVVAVFPLDVVVVAVVSVVRDQAADAVAIMSQVLQRSDLVLVVLVLVSHEVMVVNHQAVAAMVVEQAVAAVSTVVVVVADDLCKNNQAISSICILLQIRRLQKKAQPMKCW